MKLVIVILLIIVLILWMSRKSRIHFDNNATTIPLRSAVDAMYRSAWLGNPSSSYSREAARELERCKDIMRRLTGMEVIFTSGATEANATVLNSFSGHIITSSIEHNSILDCLGKDVTYIRPVHGEITADLIAPYIRSDTALISIMHANNETGIVNNISDIYRLAKSHGIPFHTDATQTFGKLSNHHDLADLVSVSFHKMRGPMGVGALLYRGDLVKPLICGSQNGGMRGGTENMPGISGAIASLETLVDRDIKNKKLSDMKNYIIRELGKCYKIVDIEEARVSTPKIPCLGLFGARCVTLPNTILISVINPLDKFCNIKLKKFLDTRGINVSIGSACNTQKNKPSHVLLAMDMPFIIRCGVIRISLGDTNKFSECREFCRQFRIGLAKQGVYCNHTHVSATGSSS